MKGSKKSQISLLRKTLTGIRLGSAVPRRPCREKSSCTIWAVPSVDDERKGKLIFFHRGYVREIIDHEAQEFSRYIEKYSSHTSAHRERSISSQLLYHEECTSSRCHDSNFSCICDPFSKSCYLLFLGACLQPNVGDHHSTLLWIPRNCIYVM